MHWSIRYTLAFAILAAIVMFALASAPASTVWANGYSSAYWWLSDHAGGKQGITTALIILAVLLGLVRFIRYQLQP